MMGGMIKKYFIIKIMILKFLTIYTILTSLAAVNLVPGNHTVTLTVPNTPKVSAYGWPPLFVNVSVEAIPIRGIVQYDLLYSRTCPYSCFTGETGLDGKDLRAVNSCHLVVNQTRTLTKSWSCVICNSTKNCKSMGITEDHDLCLVFNVTAPMGSSYNCVERNYHDIITYLPPKSIQLFSRERRQLTVWWIRPYRLPMTYQVLLLKDHGQSIGKCNIMELRFGAGDNNTYTFTSLTPWTNYSVTICGGIIDEIPVNESTCTCGGPRYIPGGPVFQHTLPEEPSKPPQLQPCEVLCEDESFSATLKWQPTDGLIWNGIPTKSLITIWNSSAADDENDLGSPAITLFVPLPANYNGSMITYTIHNLSRTSNNHAKFQLCSNGGCGPSAKMSLSCEKCELQGEPGTPTGTQVPSKKPETSLTLGISIGSISLSVILILAACYAWTKRKKKRERNRRPPLVKVIGNVTPVSNSYELISDSSSDNVPYSQVDVSADGQRLILDDQPVEV